MNLTASKLDKTFNQREFGLYSVQALWLYSKTPAAMPGSIKLVRMFIEKEKTSLETITENFCTLYVKILNDAGEKEAAIKYLAEQKSVYRVSSEHAKLLATLHRDNNNMTAATNTLGGAIRDNFK